MHQASVEPVKRSPSQADEDPRTILEAVKSSLDADKAEDIVVIDLSGKSDFADFMVIATGTSSRHVASMAEKLRDKLKHPGEPAPAAEGLPQGDWVLVDAGAVVVHLFRPEVRMFYNLEKMWGAHMPLADDKASDPESE